jgi:hypothetical protein
MATLAKTSKDATHRYPTSVHWGDGYFGDGFRYLVAASDADALGTIPPAIGITAKHLQRRNLARKRWDYCDARNGG